MVFNRQEIDMMIHKNVLQIQFNEDGDKICCFTSEYLALCKDKSNFKHEVESKGRQRWCIKNWIASGSMEEPIYQIVYLPKPSNLVVLDQLNDPLKTPIPKLVV